jgi:NADH:ubiquinone reductase (H+-translocating)
MWRRKKFEQSIVVLGAGFAGIDCAKRLEKAMRKRTTVHVALVDKENHSVFQPLLPEVAAASIDTMHIINPVRMHAPGVDFDCCEVDRIDFNDQKIYFKSPEGMSLTPMPYTHLVFAVGNIPNMGVIPGMAAHGLPMKTVGDAYHIRNEALQRLEMAANTGDATLRLELLTFVTVGAGFSGVETCAELHDMLTSALRYYPELEGETIRSVLISSTDRVLPALSPSLSDYAAKRMRKNGIVIHMSRRTTSVTARSCFLDDGTVIPTRLVISTVGNSPHPLVVSTPLEKERGQLVVDEFMRCKGRTNVWAIGDCAAVINALDGKGCPPTAQFASRQGAQCADNIVRAIDGQELQPFSFKQIGYLASLGHLSAVVEIGKIRLTGFIAWWVWRTIYLSKLPGWYRRLKVMIDWTVWLFFPRDICQLHTGRTDRVAREYYSPGQVIVKQGDSADSFYSVVNGEVEVVKELEGGGERLLARLGPGSYFGEEALLEDKPRGATVRARTAVDLMLLGRADFKALAENVHSLADVFKKTRRPLPAEAAHEEDSRRSLKRIQVKERMRPLEKLVTVKTTDSLEEMCRAFQEKGVRSFPVLGDKGELLGLLDRHDISRALNNGLDPRKTSVGEIGGLELVTCFPEDDLAITGDRMHQHEVERMCVVATDNTRKLLGLIASTDVLQARIEIELVMRNPETAGTLKLSDDVLASLDAERAAHNSPGR